MPRTRPERLTSGVDCTARAPAAIMTSRAGVPTKIGLVSTSSTMTRSPRCKAVPHAAWSPWTESKNSRNGRSKPRCAVIRKTIALEQLDVAHLGARDLDGGIQDVVQQQREIARLEQARADLLHPREVLEALAQGIFGRGRVHVRHDSKTVILLQRKRPDSRQAYMAAPGADLSHWI